MLRNRRPTTTPISRRTILSGGVAAGIVLSTSACFTGIGGKKGPLPVAGLTHIALSPDGRTVAAVYQPLEQRRIELILYDWRSEIVTKLPASKGLGLSYPAYSPDGKSLVVSMNRNVALVDLRAFEIRASANQANVFEVYSPSFAPDGHHFAYFVSRIGAPTSIVLQDVDGFNTREVLDPALGIYEARDLCFVNAHEIIFQASLPRDKQLAKSIEALGRGYDETAQFRLKLDDHAGGFARPELVTPQLESRTGWRFRSNVSQLRASLDGTVFAWTGRSLSDPGGNGIPSNYEIFEMRGGLIKQVTERKTFTYGCCISGDGNTIAFTENHTRQLDFDLTILDRKSGSVVPTNLLAKLRAG